MLKSLKEGIIYRLNAFWGGVNRHFYKAPTILDTKSSLNKIIKNKCSVARFGDGEFNLIRGQELGFQKFDEQLARSLKSVLETPVVGLEIGLPDVFGDLSAYQDKSSCFWRAYMGKYRGELSNLIDYDRTYLNTNMTRFWSGYKDHAVVPEIVSLYRKIWAERDVVFIEGKFTRMGVGNDLFANCKSIKRILCPPENAFDKYDVIMDLFRSQKISKESLIILALGPTATVLARDLTKLHYQALDLGHLDVQYEYSLRNAQGKISLIGKYVNENVGGHTDISDDIIDQTYLDSILYEVY